ncbi:uncharacterized protein HMPREF1541_05981 [Cyphellophora europaea CBS 101466]|uniref:Ricin B lectin domain-containing protein n=1 Tax=Cyphellophora europaea (strain CBS 101466) TaxID=1220924 RepID=W2RTV4_CYPE1|nr:uncharacterized protein HMPREF1541_05981 [Cyphellophora europaea CBS 101466]ETN39755.1 hypothetical protein HMPREF1541_05981 [Cyphellophora europaea CBS 101466]
MAGIVLDSNTRYRIFYEPWDSYVLAAFRSGDPNSAGVALQATNISVSDSSDAWQIITFTEAIGTYAFRSLMYADRTVLLDVFQVDNSNSTRPRLIGKADDDPYLDSSLWTLALAGGDKYFIQNLANSTSWFLGAGPSPAATSGQIIEMYEGTGAGTWRFEEEGVISSTSAASSTTTSSSTPTSTSETPSSTTTSSSLATATSSSAVSSGSSLSGGAKAGVAVGVVIAVLAAALLALLYLRKRKRQRLVGKSYVSPNTGGVAPVEMDMNDSSDIRKSATPSELMGSYSSRQQSTYHVVPQELDGSTEHSSTRVR